MRKPKTKTNRPKVWSRKGRCPSCQVQTGSKHSRACTFDYLPNKNKMKLTNTTTLQIARIIGVIFTFWGYWRLITGDMTNGLLMMILGELIDMPKAKEEINYCDVPTLNGFEQREI